MTHLRRFFHPRALLISTFLVPVLASCGGGGGGGSSKKPPIIAATPAPTTPGNPGSCDNGSFTPNYASSVSLLRWPLFSLRVYFTPDAQFSEARKASALAGFNQWVSATDNRADYIVVDSASKANVTVSFYKFTGGSGDVLGTATVNYDEKNFITRATIKLGITGNSANDTLTAAHEYGHTLGITGHSPNPRDLMYFTANSTGAITASDLNTVKTAYCDDFNRNTNRTRAAVGTIRTVVSH